MPDECINTEYPSAAREIKNPPFIITYLRVGKLLHLITIFELLLLYILWMNENFCHWITTGWLPVKVFVFSYFLSLPLFAQLDARSRYQNYKQAKDQLFIHGYRSLILLPFLKSRCQRDAVVTAGDELGMGMIIRQFYYRKGYRWYHLLPDFSFRQPQFLLTRLFWVNTFFATEYNSKIDFKQL